MIKGHGGNIFDLARQLNCPVHEIIDMSSNLNPLGPPPGLCGYLADQIDTITALPEVDALKVRLIMAESLGLEPECILAASGTTQFIYALPRILGLRKALILGPTYADYADACKLNECSYFMLLSTATNNFQPDLDQLAAMADQTAAVFICNPNNPTGSHIPVDMLVRLCQTTPNTLFIIDESYLPFHSRGNAESIIPHNLPNVIVLHSFSKIYRIPGLRIGFLIAPRGIIELFSPYLLPWSVNSLACAAVDYLAFHPREIEGFVQATREYIQSERNWFGERFKGASHIRLFPGQGPFIMARLAAGMTAESVCGELARHKILIRNCANFEGLTQQDIRFSFKIHEQNQMLAQKLIDLPVKGSEWHE